MIICLPEFMSELDETFLSGRCRMQGFDVVHCDSKKNEADGICDMEGKIPTTSDDEVGIERLSIFTPIMTFHFRKAEAV